MSEDFSLWKYALATYQRPGVAEACLALQDRHDADVNLLLAAGWLAGRGGLWCQEQVGELVYLCSDWRERCLLPLRSVRRYLRERMGEEHGAIGGLYGKAKLLELEAERYQLRLIEERIIDIPAVSPEQSPAQLLAANLDVCLALLPGGLDDCRDERAMLLQALS